jgi:thiamine-monophosphate kinase
MRVKRSEASLIERIRRAVPSVSGAGRRADVPAGIGDDAAVLQFRRSARWAVSCDSVLENIHFLAGAQPAHSVGYKSLARATSDLAAMGAAPKFFLLSLALPAQRTGAWLDAFGKGMSQAAREFGMLLIGGDVARHPTILVSVTVFGELPFAARMRSGARAGDLLFVSGRLGAAAMGNEIVLRGLHRTAEFKPLLRPLFYPEIRVDLGMHLANRRGVSAMIDISDGLSTDLARLCAASGVGARLRLESIPRVSVPASLVQRGFNAGQLALHGGEDYELLFTARRAAAKNFPAAWRGVPLTRIGEITPQSRGIRLIQRNGRSELLRPRGWDHFR